MILDIRISINVKLESEVMISERGVRMDLFVIKFGSILFNLYKGKNVMSEFVSILFYIFKCFFKKSFLCFISILSRKRVVVWNICL